MQLKILIKKNNINYDKSINSISFSSYSPPSIKKSPFDNWFQKNQALLDKKSSFNAYFCNDSNFFIYNLSDKLFLKTNINNNNVTT